jgi:hypothetical protein
MAGERHALHLRCETQRAKRAERVGLMRCRIALYQPFGRMSFLPC